MSAGKLPDWLIVASRTALLGEIYPEIRAIVYKYSEADGLLAIRYYLDREPIEKDWESIAIVNINIYSALGIYIKKTTLECVYSLESLSKIDNLDGFIYARREYEN